MSEEGFEECMKRLFTSINSNATWKSINRLDLFEIVFNDRRNKLDQKDKRIAELEAEIEKYEHIIQYIYDTCLCERFATEGFDYNEKHPNREKKNSGKRPATPRDIIESKIGFEWKYDDNVKPYKSWKELKFNKPEIKRIMSEGE